MLSIIKNFVITFCVSVLIFGLLAYFIVGFLSDSVFPAFGTDISNGENGDSETNDRWDPSTDKPDDSKNGEDEENPEEGQEKGETFTALLIGTDYQPELLDDYDVTELNLGMTGFPVRARAINADTIMIIRADKENKTFVFSALPSNMRVMVDGNNTMLGSLYQSKGISYMAEKVTAVTGLAIDYYAAVSIEDFAEIIDQLDGLTFTVPTDMRYEDDSQELSIDISKGSRTLDGKTALDMLRYNLYANGNASRMTLSVSFMKAFVKKAASAEYFPRAYELYSELSRNVETNFTLDDLAANIELIFAYPEFAAVELNYPGSSIMHDGEIFFEPNIDGAVSMYRNYYK